jgi:Tfp pilus assembly protein PilN
MIEINLLPEELRVKIKGRAAETVKEVTPSALLGERLLIYLIPAVLGLLILTHFCLTVLLVIKNTELASLNRKWSNLANQRKSLEEFNQEFSGNEQYAGFLQQQVAQRILWAQKLNELSLQLPAGVWFNEISINSGNLTVRGSVISLEKNEVGLLNKLLDNLKATTAFAKDFTNLELNNLQKRTIGGYDIADFVIVGALKTK